MEIIAAGRVLRNSLKKAVRLGVSIAFLYQWRSKPAPFYTDGPVAGALRSVAPGYSEKFWLAQRYTLAPNEALAEIDVCYATQ